MHYVCICTYSCIMLMHTPLQITDTDLMELIRANVKLTIPYAGAFLKKEDRYTVHDTIYHKLKTFRIQDISCVKFLYFRQMTLHHIIVNIVHIYSVDDCNVCWHILTIATSNFISFINNQFIKAFQLTWLASPG